MKRLSLILLLALPLAFLGYRIRFPNDFFISDKSFRKSMSFLVEKSFSKYQIVRRSALDDNLKGFLGDPNFFLGHPINIIKDNHKRTIRVVKIGSSKFFVKRYKYKNLFDYITKCPFRSSKAYRSFYYADAFEKAGLSTPQPIALIEKRVGPLWTSTYLIFKHEDVHTLEEFFKEATEDQKKIMMNDLSSKLEVFYKNKWVHRDLCLRNIMLKDGEILFLDLDDMHSYAFENRFFKRKFYRKHLEKLAKDMQISKEKLSSDFLNF